MTESLSLEIAEEYMRMNSWLEAYETLRPLWSALTWRHSGWWYLMERFAWALRECALRVKDSETVLRVDWELLNWGRLLCLLSSFLFPSFLFSVHIF